MEKTNKTPIIIRQPQPSFFGSVMKNLAALFKAGHMASVSAGGKMLGRYPFHNHGSRTFKKNQRIERRISRRRGMKASAR